MSPVPGTVAQRSGDLVLVNRMMLSSTYLEDWIGAANRDELDSS
jgi:hypothetical protein